MKLVPLSFALSLLACGGSSSRSAAPVPPGHDHAAHHAHHGHHAVGGHGDHDFKDAAAWAKVFDDPARDAWQKPEEVVALLGALPGQVVADVGAGTGYFERYLSRAVGGAGVVYALDTEPDMVEYLTARAARDAWPNVVAKLVVPGDPGLTSASVDRVLIVDTWHHLPDRLAYARLLAAALRPGGAIAVVDFAPDAPMGPPPAMRLAADRVVAELAQAGLDARIADESLPHQYVVLAHKPTGR